ncbi:MAG: hypothetical protein FWH16_00465 [Oscillospiraceae bacterium]|nr:hypothetical protein [Oscillospiraceae bacterium]
MKKRFAALFFVIAFSLIIMATVSGMPDFEGASAPPTILELPQVYNADGTAAGTKYAIIPHDKITSANAGVSWKDFGNAVLPGDKADITKLLNTKTVSYLIIPKTADLATIKTIEALADIGYDIYKLLPPEAKPKINKPTFTEADGVIFAVFDFDPDKYQYQMTGETTWENCNDVVDGKFAVPLREYRVDFNFRLMPADAEKNTPSQAIKVTVPAMANPVSTKLDIARGEIKAKAGWEIEVVASGSTKTTTLTSAVTFVTGGDGDISTGSLGDGATMFRYRLKSTTGKPGSEWSEINLNIGISEELSGDPTKYFTFTGKTNIMIIGAVPIQIKDANGRWKTVKNINASKDIPADTGVEVRMAGTRTRLPGPPKTLRCDLTDGRLTLG